MSNVGTESKPLRLIALIPNSYPNAAALGKFIRAVPASKWLHAMQTAYPMASGAPPNRSARVMFVDDMPSMETVSRTVGEYQDYIFNKATAAGFVGAPDYQTIYVLYIPCKNPHGMDHFGCESHHPRLDPSRGSESSLFTSGDSMAVVLTAATFAQATRAASHETAEAYTDTSGVGEWRLHTAFPDDPWFDAPPWVRDSGTIEMADMAAGSAWYETDAASGKTFQYQRIYSPYRSAHHFNDWMVPSSPYPQYNVSDGAGNLFTGWHHVVSTQGPLIGIKMTAWAEAPIGSFTVNAKVRTSGGTYANPCSLPVTSWAVQDGSQFKLKVKTKAVAAGQHIWCSVQLVSTRSGAPVHDDASHWWVVGILVTGS